MDALKKFIFFLALNGLLLGCSNPKEAQSIFPETSQGCKESAHPNRYLVKLESGEILIRHATSRKEFLETYVEPNLQHIHFVEQDQKIFLPSVQDSEPSQALETWGPTRIQASSAWNEGLYGQNVLVAVIDSGVDTSHPAISESIYTNIKEAQGKPEFDDDGNGLVDDIHGWNFDKNTAVNIDEVDHGTHVTGIISAQHSSPVKGVAPQAQILPIDFMDEYGGFTGNSILSIRYAVSMGARIINASWGSNACSQLLEEEIQSLENKNILFIAAAGNSGNNLSVYPEYPAAYTLSAQITVSALSTRGYMAWFTNFGSLSNVMAPGESILSSIPNGTYKYLNGTSMATPMVSGVAALLLSQKPEITAIELKKIILDSVTKGPFDVSTRGEISVSNALQKIKSL